MGKAPAFANDLLALIFHGTAIANIADNAASSPLTDLYVSLHTAEPSIGDDQTSNECVYGGYARVQASRSSSAWTISGRIVTPATDIAFPRALSGEETATHWAIGTAASGTGKVLYVGTLAPAVDISEGVEPKIKTDSSLTET